MYMNNSTNHLTHQLLPNRKMNIKFNILKENSNNKVDLDYILIKAR